MCRTKVEGITFEVIYDILPDKYLSEDVLLGRDILEQGINVELSNDKLTFTKFKTSNSCSLPESFDESLVDTDLIGENRDRLIGIH